MIYCLVSLEPAPVPPFGSPEIDRVCSDFMCPADILFDLVGAHRYVLLLACHFPYRRVAPWLALKLMDEHWAVQEIFDDEFA